MNTIETEPIAKRCVEILEQHKAADIQLFDVRERSIIADFFIVSTATSMPHLRALAEHIRRTLLDEGIKPRGRDGNPSSQWLVLDYGIIIVHIMTPELRRFYALEDIWDKSKIIYTGGEPLPPQRPGAAPQAPAIITEDVDEGYPIDERFLDPDAAEDEEE